MAGDRTGSGEADKGVFSLEENKKNNKSVENTFLVRIQRTENATWQGQVVWTEEKVSKSFRSALELLKLIDSAVEEAEKQSAAPTETLFL